MKKTFLILSAVLILIAAVFSAGFIQKTPAAGVSDKPVHIAPLNLPGLTDVDENEEKGILYWQKTLYGSANAADFVGEPVEVTGFVHRLENDSEDVFFIARNIVYCCVNDAFPQGLGVFLEDNDKYEEGDWYTVRGKWAQIDFDGKLRNMIIPDSIETAEEPEDPYIYP